MFPSPFPDVPPPTEPWTQEEALELAVVLESVLHPIGWHVALTGGCLYKEGQRKDADFIVYRNSPKVELKQSHVVYAIQKVHVTCVAVYTRVAKCLYKGKSVDIIIPEIDGEYV